MDMENVVYKGNVVDMGKLSGQIKEIQGIALTLTESSELKEIDTNLGKLISLCGKASLTIEDGASSIAGYLFKNDIKKDVVTLKQLAFAMGKIFKDYDWPLYKKELDDLQSKGLLPTVKKHGRLYANQATLAGWLRNYNKLRETKKAA